MTDLSARNRRNKTKGSQYETDLVNFFRTKYLNTERLTKKGKDDEGDIVIKVKDLALILEAKNEKAMNLSGYMAEATSEAIRWEAARIHEPNPMSLVIGAAAVKRRSHSIAKTYIVMEADDLAALLLHLQTR